MVLITFDFINCTKQWYLIINVRRLSGGIEWWRTDRALKTSRRVSDRTLSRSNGAWSRYRAACLRAVTARALLLRLHLRGNQLRIRQRVSVFPHGTTRDNYLFPNSLHHYPKPRVCYKPNERELQKGGQNSIQTLLTFPFPHLSLNGLQFIGWTCEY